ncbi:UDP-glucose dehydrogenase family protein [Maritalea mediterranea]|uniref:UDP-glucose 6-dehydrogenase n=1 Tax=Maritalea mediterranea TaxID=2909667 RepID=A0ABS9E780_9HYPH|nr:UDP-glucose/GDP-mannose dehydrogenase family protein [Maritalea mediterranea]MCF4098742.1 UDP-glucose/GDP-mannose dehydrogenase family protein [Maritalea mediterranea]
MKIAVIGVGYVGLVSGVCLAEVGHEITCVDLDQAKIDKLNQNHVPIYERGLEDMVAANRAAGHLHFTTDLAAALKDAEAAFIAVGTPSRESDGHADLSYIYAAAKNIAEQATDPLVIINKSTVPVGTGDEVENIVKTTRPDLQFDIVSNPEFLREGAAIEDFMAPDRIVIGVETDHARKVMAEIYAPFAAQGYPILYVNRRTSELTKYAANSFLALKLAYINEVAELCEVVGADIKGVSKGIGLDPRIGEKFLNAGPGYGGSCFPKDTLALVRTAQDHERPLRLIEMIVSINEYRKRAMSRKIAQMCENEVKGKKIAILGLTFKPNTDDMREAPSIAIIQGLQDMGTTIHAYDPEGMENAKRYLNNITYCDSALACVDSADAAVIVTEWDEFRTLPFAEIKTRMRKPVLVDLRNLYDGQSLKAVGFDYQCVGRPQETVINSMPVSDD